jgi:FdhE protein
MNPAEWDRRIRRANELTSFYPFAAEGLRFYARLASFQRSLYREAQEASNGSAKAPVEKPLREELDLFFLLPKFSGFLALIQQIAPAPLAQAAADLARGGTLRWQQVIEEFWHAAPVEEGVSRETGTSNASEASPQERLLAWIFLQPYAECLADQRGPLTVGGAPSTCPMCGGNPIVGVLRPEGDGARKSLVCMLCAHEWGFRRIYCPACGEEREPHMAFYSAPEIAHVRVDVCDTCKTYLKSIDLTKTGLAVPIVDELATIPLDLWAREHGYEKLQTNLLGT